MKTIGTPLDATALPYQTLLDWTNNALRKFSALGDEVQLGGG